MNAKTRPILMLVIGLFFGGGLGFLLASPPPPAHDHGAHDHSVAHDRLADTDPDAPQPGVTLHLAPESATSANLHIIVENFRFAPENVNGDAVPGEGHAHVYIDGTKIARVYGPWVHLDNIPPEAQEVTVTLNANDHATLASGGKPVTATASLDILR